MSTRIEMIERLAETDDYWKGYLDGMNRTRAADDPEWREYARLTAAREGRRASFMADKLSMDEARVKVAEDWDDDWTPTPAA